MLLGARLEPMNELVHWILHSRSLSSLRFPSFAGKGLTERMRSTGFALLGLTAAAGLAMVAIFAQPGFPLLDPAPLPDEPSISQSVAEAEKLPVDHKPSTFTPAVAPRAVALAPASAESRGHGSEDRSAGGGNAAVQSPAPPVSAPEASGDGNGGSGGGAPAPAPTPASDPVSPPAPTPVSSPKPTGPPSRATTSLPSTAEPVSGPGNSSSAAAAEHASQRGIEASSSSGPPAAAAAADTSATGPGNGNGLAKGLSK